LFSFLALQFLWTKLDNLPIRWVFPLFQQTNLDKPEAVTACVNRKTAARKKHAVSAAANASSSSSSTEQPKYVDRAAVRRSTYNQSDHPEPPSKRKKFDAPEPPAPTPEAPNKDGLEETNTGMKMLEKMVRYISTLPIYHSGISADVTYSTSRVGRKELV